MFPGWHSDESRGHAGPLPWRACIRPNAGRWMAPGSRTSPICTSVAARRKRRRCGAACARRLSSLECRLRHRDRRLTHRGLSTASWIYTRSTFAPLLADGRLISIPGNHDCLGEDVSGAIMSGPRVQAARYPGLYVVRVNSTAPHNRSWLSGHGSLDEGDLDAIDVALDAAPTGHLVVIALHHHVLRMPEEHAMERLSSWLGFVYTTELRARARPAGSRARAM